MRRALTLALLGAALAGCSGRVDGTPTQLVRGAAQRTLSAKTAHVVVRYEDGVRREGDVELRGDRGRIVEHGEFGYREYRFMDRGWYQVGGKIGDIGEDMGGKWLRFPRVGHGGEDILRDYQRVVRSLAHATRIRALGDDRYRATIGGARVTLRLDARGRLRVLRAPETVYRFDDFGTDVDVERPPKSEIYIGHD